MPPQDPATALARQGETRAVLSLGDESIAVRLDGEGYLSRVQRKIRLYYGPHLYAACRPGSERPEEKVTPYQPGYMMLVEAMGGLLVCPPVIQVQEGEKRVPRANPVCHSDPQSGITYRVEATAVCLLRHPITGQLVPSAGPTAVVDARQTLMQGLMKITREDMVRLVPDDQVVELRAGECKGWGHLPLGGGVSILFNLRIQGVRDVLQDYVHLTGTIRQRAVSKAERLAADHHPLLRGRCSWTFGQLRSETGKDGRVLRRYVEVSTVSWVEKAGRFDRQSIMAALERMGADADVQTVVEEPVDVDLGADPDAPDLEPGEMPREMPALEQTPEEPPVQAREQVPVQAQPEVLREEAVKTAAQAIQTPAIRERTDKTLRGLTPEAIQKARALAQVGDTPLDAMTDSQLRALARAALE